MSKWPLQEINSLTDIAKWKEGWRLLRILAPGLARGLKAELKAQLLLVPRRKLVFPYCGKLTNSLTSGASNTHIYFLCTAISGASLGFLSRASSMFNFDIISLYLRVSFFWFFSILPLCLTPSLPKVLIVLVCYNSAISLPLGYFYYVSLLAVTCKSENYFFQNTCKGKVAPPSWRHLARCNREREKKKETWDKSKWGLCSVWSSFTPLEAFR